LLSATVSGGAAVQRGVNAVRVVVRLELGQFSFQVTPVPEEHIIKEFAPYHSDQALD
jgi:hypothetical protein